MVEIITGDLLKVERGLVCQQVNCKGAMGSGIALSFKKKYPAMYYDYHHTCLLKDKALLGTLDLHKVGFELILVNMFAQYSYSTKHRTTDYAAFQSCLDGIARLYQSLKFPVYLPYKIGCGYGGGDWNIVLKMIQDTLKDTECYIVRLDDSL